jgi:hypothetical protein
MASGPPASRAWSPASSRILTPSSTALAYLEPGSSPATTKFVFFDTDDATLPPAARTASAASSRLIPGSVPVITTVTPASSRDAAADGSNPGVSSCTPPARHLATIATCQSTVNHSTTDAAIVGPTPSTIARASGDAAAIASSDPKASASALAAVGPTWRIDSATRIRHSGRVFASSRLASSACALTLRPPALFTKNGLVARASPVSPNRSPSFPTRPPSSRATTAS